MTYKFIASNGTVKGRHYYTFNRVDAGRLGVRTAGRTDAQVYEDLDELLSELSADETPRAIERRIATALGHV